MFYGVRKLAFARDVHSPDRPRISIGGLGMTGRGGSSSVRRPDITCRSTTGGIQYESRALSAMRGVRFELFCYPSRHDEA